MLRKRGIIISLVILLVLALAVQVNVADPELPLEGQTQECNSCVYCTTVASDAGYIKLTTNLTQYTTCITISHDDIVFDCQGYTLDSNSSSGQKGFLSNTFNNITIKNCILTDWDNAILISSGKNITLYNNTFIDSAPNQNDAYIFIQSTNNTNISMNTFSKDIDGYSNAGLLFNQNSRSHHIYNNTFNNLTKGLLTWMSGYSLEYLNITNNIFNDNDYSFYFYDLATTSNNIIANNSLNGYNYSYGGADKMAFYFTRPGYVRVAANLTDNLIDGSERLYVFKDTEDISFNHNIINKSHHSNYGKAIFLNVSNVTIYNNTFEHDYMGVSVINSSWMNISSNFFNETSKSSDNTASLYLWNISNSTIDSNIFGYNGGVDEYAQLRITLSYGNIFKNNIFNGFLQYGLFLNGGIYDSWLENNTFVSSTARIFSGLEIPFGGYGAITIDEASYYNGFNNITIKNNNLSYYGTITQYGLRDSSPSLNNLTVFNNTFHGYNYSAYITSIVNSSIYNNTFTGGNDFSIGFLLDSAQTSNVNYNTFENITYGMEINPGQTNLIDVSDNYFYDFNKTIEEKAAFTFQSPFTLDSDICSTVENITDNYIDGEKNFRIVCHQIDYNLSYEEFGSCYSDQGNIILYNVSNSTVSNNNITAGIRGIYAGAGKNLTIKDNSLNGTSVGTSKGGIHFYQMQDSLIKNNYIGTSDGLDNDYSIIIQATNSTTVKDNDIVDPDLMGIQLFSLSSEVSYNIIKNNVIRDVINSANFSNPYGLIVVNIQGANSTGNVILDNNLSLSEQSLCNTTSGSGITFFTSVGAAEGGEDPRPPMRSMENISDDKGEGEGGSTYCITNTTINNNTFFNTSLGIVLEKGCIQNNTISNNTIHEGFYGITIRGSDTGFILNNNFINNNITKTQYGLYLTLNGSVVQNNYFYENKIDSSKQYDFYIDNDTNPYLSNYFYNNTFYNEYFTAGDSSNYFNTTLGNRWLYYDEESEGCYDVSPQNTFCDTSYSINVSSEIDYLPRAYPVATIHNVTVYNASKTIINATLSGTQEQNITINVSLVDGELATSSVFVIIWQTVKDGAELFRGFLTEFTNYWSIDIETDTNYDGVINYTVYVNDSLNHTTYYDGNFSIEEAPEEETTTTTPPSDDGGTGTSGGPSTVGPPSEEEEEENETKIEKEICQPTLLESRENKFDVLDPKSGVVWVKVYPKIRLTNIFFSFDSLNDLELSLAGFGDLTSYSFFKFDLDCVIGECRDEFFVTEDKPVTEEDIEKVEVKFGVSQDWLNKNNITFENVSFYSYQENLGMWQKEPIKYMYLLDGVEYFMATTTSLSFYSIGADTFAFPFLNYEEPPKRYVHVVEEFFHYEVRSYSLYFFMWLLAMLFVAYRLSVLGPAAKADIPFWVASAAGTGGLGAMASTAPELLPVAVSSTIALEGLALAGNLLVTNVARVVASGTFWTAAGAVVVGSVATTLTAIETVTNQSETVAGLINSANYIAANMLWLIAIAIFGASIMAWSIYKHRWYFRYYGYFWVGANVFWLALGGISYFLWPFASAIVVLGFAICAFWMAMHYLEYTNLRWWHSERFWTSSIITVVLSGLSLLLLLGAGYLYVATNIVTGQLMSFPVIAIPIAIFLGIGLILINYNLIQVARKFHY